MANTDDSINNKVTQ